MKHDRYKELLRALKILRIYNDIPQAEVASYIKLSPSSYSRKERGDLTFTILEYLELLAFYELLDRRRNGEIQTPAEVPRLLQARREFNAS